jgi:hypothetical protein
MLRLLATLVLLGILAALLIASYRRRKAEARHSRNIEILRWVGVTGAKRVPAPAPHRSLESPMEEKKVPVDSEPLPVNCLHEEYVQLGLARCSCGGSYSMVERAAVLTRGNRPLDLVEAKCTACGRRRKFHFDALSSAGSGGRAALEPTRPSQLMDVLSWLEFAADIEASLPPHADAVRGQALRELDFALTQALLFYETGSSVLSQGALFNHPELKNRAIVSLPTRDELETRLERIRHEVSRLLH